MRECASTAMQQKAHTKSTDMRRYAWHCMRQLCVRMRRLCEQGQNQVICAGLCVHASFPGEPIKTTILYMSTLRPCASARPNQNKRCCPKKRCCPYGHLCAGSAVVKAPGHMNTKTHKQCTTINGLLLHLPRCRRPRPTMTLTQGFSNYLLM